MTYSHRLLSWKVPLLLASLIGLTLFILACGGDDEVAATQAPATAAPAPATQAPAPATAMPATQAPRATAAPTATATQAMVEKIPVSPRLIVSVVPPSDQFTMAHAQAQTSEKIMPIYEHLVGRHYQTDVEEPELASDWSVSPDGRVWTFNLRDDVPFYRNGKPTDMMFSAQDAVLAFNLLTGILTDRSRSPGLWLGRLGRDESAWIVENDHRLRIELPKIVLDLPFFVSEKWNTGMPSKAWWDTVGGEDGYMADPIGNGPWSYIDLNLNVNVLHERVDNHWRKTPEFHEFEILFVKEGATRLAQLINGEVAIVQISRSLRGVAEAAGMVTARAPCRDIIPICASPSTSLKTTAQVAKRYQVVVSVAQLLDTMSTTQCGTPRCDWH